MTASTRESTEGTADRWLSEESADRLLDFKAKSALSDRAAKEQLRGAVAVHNLLQSEGVAYLADEVGMGKTYVALGAVALLRHFNPNMRTLVIAPRENIQKKWIKEVGNFTDRNVRFSDLRTRSLQGTPVRGGVICDNLIELVRETAADPDRDFFARLTSFSLPLGAQIEGWREKRRELLRLLPWLPEDAFSLRDRDSFKLNFARAVNAALPAFDLVVVDEAHNLKHGFALTKSTSSRNRVLGLTFGHADGRGQENGFVDYGPRARKVLLLSATPVEETYEQLWNQLNLFGLAGPYSVLKDNKATDESKRDCAKRFLVRRVAKLVINGQERTKNQYRREWHRGGVAAHDDPMQVPTEKQRLIVALVQKKVSEVLGAAKFSNSFQIGMLASFESFLQTAKVASSDANEKRDPTFDDPDQTEDPHERLGVDVGEVNKLADSYRRNFHSELPHPKMDALVERLSESFRTGQKALVFVRRVASVTELKRKLDERYNEHLVERLRRELKPALQRDMERLVSRFHEEREAAIRRRAQVVHGTPLPEGEKHLDDLIPADTGDPNSFFGWFFRGEGPDGVLSGATLARRFNQAGALQSTFFEDNYVAWLLGAKPGDVSAALSTYLGMAPPEMATALEVSARRYLPAVKKQPRLQLFRAFQHAVLEFVAERKGKHQSNARMILEERFQGLSLPARRTHATQPLGEWLEERTFISALRERPRLRQHLWPEPQNGSARERFKERELRRELLSAMSRLGHPFIDLYVLTINRIGRFKLRARELEATGGNLIDDFLDLLERQAGSPEENSGFRELEQAAVNFELIVSVNDPGLRSLAHERAAAMLGRMLGRQQPVGGMAGQVNQTLVRQFRMPGYPYVLVTTDLLQEGEDLHTFCSAVYHYGISWMPSAMEQRVGRVDRVGSLTDRRLSGSKSEPPKERLLQVLYPHLDDSVEALQVHRVLERMNRFMVLMHQDIRFDMPGNPTVNVAEEMLRTRRPVPRITETLRTAFPGEEYMTGPNRRLVVGQDLAASLRKRFHALKGAVKGRIHFEDHGGEGSGLLFGSIHLHTRKQPFTLFMRSVGGRPTVRCVSPVGQVADPHQHDVVRDATEGTGVRVAVFEDERFKTYNVAIEGDVLLGNAATDAARVQWLLDRVTNVADTLEREILETDADLEHFREALKHEVAYER